MTLPHGSHTYHIAWRDTRNTVDVIIADKYSTATNWVEFTVLERGNHVVVMKASAAMVKSITLVE